MDILHEAQQIASSRWAQTADGATDEKAKTTLSIAEELLAQTSEACPGWEPATIYRYSCYEGHCMYCVTLWKTRGIRDGYALVGLRVCLFEQDEEGVFRLRKVEKML